MKDSKHQNLFDSTGSVHYLEPDYTKPLLKIPETVRKRMAARLQKIYGKSAADEYMPELERIMTVYYAHKPPEMIEREQHFLQEERFTQQDIILITYGDLIRSKDRPPLAALAELCDTYLRGVINTLHILPFFPYSSDKGFSIINFEEVDPNLGTWKDIENLEGRYKLMFDGVINHISAKSEWFQEFLNGHPYYQDFFTSYKSRDELTPHQRQMIFRPRCSNILSEYMSINGKVYVWTTFSRDQIDLNYKNPRVLLKMIDVLLFYVRRGADIIRLDAVTYLWEEPGTRCVHLEETHEIIKLCRDVLDCVAPTVALITETNVPHEENMSYFGDGNNEAHMVYNFALPPLVLHTFYSGDATALSNWAAGMEPPSNTTTFFNLLDSHDGIGVLAAEDILNQEEIDNILKRAAQHGGLISYKTAADGTEKPYEINITWYSALNREDSGEELLLQVKRFVASRSIALVLKGVPGIYLHGLMGTPNDIQAVEATHSKRAINRTVFDEDALLAKMQDESDSKLSLINRYLGRILYKRTQRRVFHPRAAQFVLNTSPAVFSILRVSPEGEQRILTLTNVTAQKQRIDVPLSEIGSDIYRWFDILGKQPWYAEGDKLTVWLDPYDVIWLEPFRK